ncbi:hypothetical protein HYDPIDRAFT_104544 [Hydnomerulius pinastri MD-312]|nr:hypothetical protein HYDPIDRAFT_104544 [Hydnomerulius pinastri MD-312]
MPQFCTYSTALVSLPSFLSSLFTFLLHADPSSLHVEDTDLDKTQKGGLFTP